MVCSVTSYTPSILKWLVMCTEVDIQVKFVLVPDPKVFSTLISNNDSKPFKHKIVSHRSWCTHLIPATVEGGGITELLWVWGQSGIQKEFQDSQGLLHRETLSLINKNKQTNQKALDYKLKQVAWVPTL